MDDKFIPLILVTHKTILESLSQRGALALGGFGNFGVVMDNLVNQ